MEHQEKEITQMTTDRISSVISRLWKSTLALGALTLILGAVVLIWPGQSIVVAGVLFGVYLLASGKHGTVHIEQVLEYNQDPWYLRDLLLYKLTIEAQNRPRAC